MSKTGDVSPTASWEAESRAPSLGAGEPNLSRGNWGTDLTQGTGKPSPALRFATLRGRERRLQAGKPRYIEQF